MSLLKINVFLCAQGELALVMVLVSNACFRDVISSHLLKMRRLNIVALIIQPHHCAKIADHSHGFKGQKYREKTQFCHTAPWCYSREAKVTSIYMCCTKSPVPWLLYLPDYKWVLSFPVFIFLFFGLFWDKDKKHLWLTRQTSCLFIFLKINRHIFLKKEKENIAFF